MTTTTFAEEKSATRVLLGDEAAALGAVHAGIAAAYAYPGTPSTEILEFLIRLEKKQGPGAPHAAWCANEKTAYEEALGVSMVGRRALVAMKHVGLNVAADPFINSAIVSLHGGLVAMVADDPGMHSSQNEQDSRFYADFARVICLEPSDQQEAYEMAREAFDLSELFRIPILLRLVTRLAHSRAVIRTRAESGPPAAPRKPPDRSSWILLPGNARRQWRSLLERQPEIRAFTEACRWNPLELNREETGLGIITAGIARNYYLENVDELPFRPSHLHVGAYPPPFEKIRALAGQVKSILVLEEGYPYLETAIRGVLATDVEIRGKLSGHLPPDGELTPDVVRSALALPARQGIEAGEISIPGRPPQLCPGCPHADAYTALAKALSGFERSLVTSDIGCYTLGALPPYSAIESCVCMGASVGMAKGAAEAGFRPVVAVIGDSTFLHSGVTPLMDAVAADADMTLLILDNEVVAMTGTQPTILPSSRLQGLVLGLGVHPNHCHVVQAHPRKIDEIAALLRSEIDHRGLSVVIAVRECLESARKNKSAR